MSATAPPRIGNEIGRMTGLTLLTPVRPSGCSSCGSASSCRGTRRSSTATSCSSTSSSSCAGRSCATCRARGSPTSYMLFESNFDGPWQHYIDALRLRHPEGHPPDVGARHQLPPPAAVRAAEGVDRAQQHGGRHLLLRVSGGEHAHGPRRARRARALRARWRATPSGIDPGGVPAAYERFLVEAQARPLMAEYRNRVGGVYALTVFTPIVPGHEDELRAHLEALPVGAESPLARLDELHLSRIQIIDALVDQGPPHRRGDAEAPPPALHEHGRRRARPLPRRDLRAHRRGGRRLVGALRRLPGHRRPRGVQALDPRPQGRHAACSPWPIPGGPCRTCVESLALRERVVAFAAAAQGLDAAALHERFLASFADVR